VVVFFDSITSSRSYEIERSGLIAQSDALVDDAITLFLAGASSESWLQARR
jgi:hypothetical protein